MGANFKFVTNEKILALAELLKNSRISEQKIVDDFLGTNEINTFSKTDKKDLKLLVKEYCLKIPKDKD